MSAKDNQYVCPACNKGFRWKDMINVGMRSQPDFICRYCDALRRLAADSVFKDKIITEPITIGIVEGAPENAEEKPD